MFVGRAKEKMAPMPDGLFEPHILPPWASTIFLKHDYISK